MPMYLKGLCKKKIIITNNKLGANNKLQNRTWTSPSIIITAIDGYVSPPPKNSLSQIPTDGIMKYKIFQPKSYLPLPGG